MTDKWEWDTSHGDFGGSPEFRQFKKDKSVAGENGLWVILDSVARQPSRPERSRRVTEPTATPATVGSSFSSAAKGFLSDVVRPSVPAPPVAPLSQSAPPLIAPTPIETTPPAVAPQPASSGFGHLFKRPREAAAAPAQGGTPLKSLFRRIG